MSISKSLATLAIVASSSMAGNLWVECGLGGVIGSMVGGKAGNVIATVTNVTFDLGTTATTSDISSPDLCANREAASAKFINDTYKSLEAETANGQGSNLSTLLDIAETDVMMRDMVVSQLRAGFAKEVASSEFSSMTDTQKAQIYHRVFMNVISG